MLVWTQGRFLDDADVRIAPGDRGFLLGDGVFDTFRIRDGAPLHLDAHLARLRAAADAFGIPVPFDDADIDGAARALAARNALPDAAARLTISRGEGPRGLVPPDPAHPFVLLRLAPAPGAPRPLMLLLSDVARSSVALSSRHKTLSYIDNVEARRRAAAHGADDALLLNERGEVACASAANIFWIADGALFTPSLECGVLPGVTRARVLRIARGMGVRAEEGRYPLSALDGAAAAFLTNSVTGAVPVAALQGAAAGRAFDVQDTLFAALRRAEAD